MDEKPLAEFLKPPFNVLRILKTCISPELIPAHESRTRRAALMGSLTPFGCGCMSEAHYRILRGVKVIRDCFGNAVRLTGERLDHVLEHVEMAELRDEIEQVLQAPNEVRRSRSDESVRLFYRFYAATTVGRKWLCVVVKSMPEDAFVITAYLTDSVKAGEILWPKS